MKIETKKVKAASKVKLRKFKIQIDQNINRQDFPQNKYSRTVKDEAVQLRKFTALREALNDRTRQTVLTS